jgi:hypothetical protein
MSAFFITAFLCSAMLKSISTLVSGICCSYMGAMNNGFRKDEGKTTRESAHSITRRTECNKEIATVQLQIIFWNCSMTELASLLFRSYPLFDIPTCCKDFSQVRNALPLRPQRYGKVRSVLRLYFKQASSVWWYD